MDKELLTKLYEQFVEDISEKILAKLLVAKLLVTQNKDNKPDLTVERIATDKLVTNKEAIDKEHWLDRFIYKVDY